MSAEHTLTEADLPESGAVSPRCRDALAEGDNRAHDGCEDTVFWVFADCVCPCHAKHGTTA